MKKVTLFIFCLICVAGGFKVQAQHCSTPASGPNVCSTANSPLTAEGFYPSEQNLPCVVDGQFYDTVIQIRTPATASGYSLNSITITSLTNLPCGLCWASGNSSDQIPGNGDGCIRVQGTSFDVPGEYLLSIIVSATVSVAGFPVTRTGQDLASQGLKFYARVKLPGGTCVTLDTNAAGLSATAAGNVSIPTISGPTSICGSGSATLTAGGGNYYGYVWSTGAQTASINVTTSGTYRVTVYENCGTATASQTVTVSSTPVVTITPPASVCLGNSATITATGGGSYNWNNGSTSASINVSPTTNANYSVTVSTGPNCSASASTSLSVNPSVTVSISPTTDTVCAGTPTTLTASGTGSTYAWSNGATTGIVTVSPTVTTNYKVTATAATGGCTATASRTVIVNSSAPTISATGPITFCTGGSVGLKVDSSYASYLWSTGATTSTVTVNQAGTYDATVTQNGCTGVSNSINVVIATNLSPTITANPTLNICPGGRTTLDAGPGYTTYTWSGGGGTHESVQVSAAGTYTVTVSSGTCNGTASATVNVSNFPLAVSISPTGPVTACSTDTVILNAGSGFASYAWSNGSQVATSQVTSSGPYSVTVTKNACIGIDTVQVTINPSPVPVITPAGPLTKCSIDTVILDAGAGFSSYAWSDGETTETIQPTTSGTYSVTATLAGCNGGATGPVEVTFNATPAPVISPAGNVSVCAGTGGVELNAGSGYSSYVWTNGETTQSISVSTAGAYNVTVTENNCSAEAAASNVSVVTRPVASIGSPVTANGFSYLTAGPVGANYLWLIQTSANGSFAATANTGQFDTVTCGNSATYYTVVATQNGCSDTSAHVEVVCTGIEEISSLVNFTIQPNPATDVLFVNYELNDNTNIKLSVIDLTGRVVQSVLNATEYKGAHQHQVNLNNISAGVYLLNFVTINGSFNAKFVKQ